MRHIKTSPYVPTDVSVQEAGKNRVKISVYPFESGYAITIAHPLRRLLLGSSVGFAPIALKIEGAAHEFDSVRGIMEDVALFIVNLKNIRFKLRGEAERVTLEYSFKGSKSISGADLVSDQVDVATPTQHLATINEDAKLSFSLIIQRGIGYVPSEEVREIIPEGYIPLDAFFTPVKKATYEIENILVEDNPTYEKIVFEVETDGLIDPTAAFKDALSVLQGQLSVFSAEWSIASAENGEAGDDDSTEIRSLIQPVESLNLSARSFNCLDRAGIKLIGELVLLGESGLKEVKNLGKKSFEEIRDKLEETGFPIGKELSNETASALRKYLSKLK
ncbi:MAG: DNA-directed RNA polymerase subunit alpha [Wolinella sp.]